MPRPWEAEDVDVRFTKRRTSTMPTLRATLFGLALLVGPSGCFVAAPPPPWRVDRLEEEHGDPRIEVLEVAPAPERDCWRHGEHWHCHHED